MDQLADRYSGVFHLASGKRTRWSRFNFWRLQFRESARVFRLNTAFETDSNEATFGQQWCSDEIWTPRQVLEMNETSCTLLVRLFDFVIASVECGKTENQNVVRNFCSKKFWSIVYLSLLAPTCLGFDVRKEEIQLGLKSTVTK